MIGRNKITKSVLADSPNKYNRKSSKKDKGDAEGSDADGQDYQTEKVHSRNGEREHNQTQEIQKETIVINHQNSADETQQQFDCEKQMNPSAPSAPFGSEELHEHGGANMQFSSKYSQDNYDLIMVSGQNSAEKRLQNDPVPSNRLPTADQKGSISGVSMKDPLMTDRIPSDEVQSSNAPSGNKLNFTSSHPSHKLAIPGLNNTQPIMGYAGRVNQQNVVLPLKTSNIKIQRVGWQNQGNANPSIMQNSFMQQNQLHQAAQKKRAHRFSSGFNKEGITQQHAGGPTNNDYRDKFPAANFSQVPNRGHPLTQNQDITAMSQSSQRKGGALSSTMQTLLGSPSPANAINHPMPRQNQAQIVLSNSNEQGERRSAAGRSRSNTAYVKTGASAIGLSQRNKTQPVQEHETSNGPRSSVGQISPMRDGRFEQTIESRQQTGRQAGRMPMGLGGSPRFQQQVGVRDKNGETTPQFKLQGQGRANNDEMEPTIKNSNPYLITSYQVPGRRVTAAEMQHYHAFRANPEKSFSPQNQRHPDKTATQYMKVHSSTHGASTATDIQDESETMNISRLGGITSGSNANAAVTSDATQNEFGNNFLQQMIHPISIASKTNYNKMNILEKINSATNSKMPQTEHQVKRPTKYKQLKGLCIDSSTYNTAHAKKASIQQQTDTKLFLVEPQTMPARLVQQGKRRNAHYENVLGSQHNKGFAGGFGGAGQVYRKLAGIETTNRNYLDPNEPNTYVTSNHASSMRNGQAGVPSPNTSPVGGRQNTAPQNQYETVDLQLTGNKALLNPTFYAPEEEVQSRNRAMITFSTDEANHIQPRTQTRTALHPHIHAPTHVGVEISRTHGNSTVDGLSADVSREHRLEAKELEEKQKGNRHSQEMDMSETQEHPINEEISDQQILNTRKAIFSNNKGESDYHDSQRQSSTRQRREKRMPDVLVKQYTQEIDAFNSGSNTPKDGLVDHEKQRNTELGKDDHMIDASASDLQGTMYETHKPTVTSVRVKKVQEPHPAHIDVKQDSLYMRQSQSRRSSAEIISIMRSDGEKEQPEGMTERLPIKEQSSKRGSQPEEHQQYYGIRVSSNKGGREDGTLPHTSEANDENPVETAEAFRRFQEESQTPLGVVGSKYNSTAIYGDYQSRVSSLVAQPRKKIAIQVGGNEDLDKDISRRAPVAGFPPSPLKQKANSTVSSQVMSRKSPDKVQGSVQKSPYEGSREARLDRSLGEFIARRVHDFLLIQERMQAKQSPKKVEIQSQLLAGQLLKEVAYIQRKQKKGQTKTNEQFTELEKRDIGLKKLQIAKPPRQFIHFKNKSEEYRYMRIVQQLQQLENETHETFVKNLLSTCRDTNKIINEADQPHYRPDQDWMEERMMFFTEELDHAYERIFRFLKDMLTQEEYEQVDYLAVTRFIEHVQTVQRASSHYEKPDVEAMKKKRALNSGVDPNASLGMAEFSMSQDSNAFSAKYKIKQGSDGFDLYQPNMPVASGGAFEFQRATNHQGQSFASQAKLSQSNRLSPALSSPVSRAFNDETHPFSIRQSDSQTIPLDETVTNEPPGMHQFICEALGIKYDNRAHTQSAFTQFAVQEREDPLWSHYTFGKDIDLGKVYESRRLQNDEDIRKGFVNMKNQERNANLQNRLLKHLVSESHESNLPVVMSTNHYSRSDKINQPLLQHMQKRSRQQKGRSRDIWTDRGQPSTKNNFVSVDVQRLAVDSSMRRNSLLLERVLLERNMANWKTQILHQIHEERNNQNNAT